jgi:carbon-monoxide dehydrogenase small subunit
MKRLITLNVNGKSYEVAIEPRQSLLQVLREALYLTGTKEGCSEGECGACTVILDGKTVDSCLIFGLEAEGCQITTIEGLSSHETLHPVQQAFVEHGGAQCGFCTPGMILAAKALLEHTPHPSEEEIRWGLSGNLCRCTGYVKIVEAVQAAALGLFQGL